MESARTRLIEEEGVVRAQRILDILVNALSLTAAALGESPIRTAIVYCQECVKRNEYEHMWAALAAADAWKKGH